MRHFYVIANPEKPRAQETAVEIADYLEKRGAVCVIGGGAAGKETLYKYTDASDVPEDTECVITLGGDGTLIQAARDLRGRGLPLAGINLGTLGYLTQVSRQEKIHPALDALLSGDCQLEQRMMLSGKAWHKGRLNCDDVALNEIVITRKELMKMLRLKIFVDGQFLNEYTSDGMIIATPTGSTAYNLSAGGPIVVPDSEMMVLTPICSHALNARSIVLPASAAVRIEILGDEAVGRSAVFDGDTVCDLHAGDHIEVKRSELYTVLVKLKELSFLDNLRSKMAGI